MLKQDLKIGDRVIFGRPNGEQTLGEIEKLNPQKAKIKILESRGSRSEVGAIWGVPYSLIHRKVEKTKIVDTLNPVSVENAKVKRNLTYNLFDEDNLLLEALLGVYSNLSPESLTCDGELSSGQVQKRHAVLQRKLRGITMALGYDVKEEEIYAWYTSKKEYEKTRKII